jgi:4-carboxymuconolactone decarboxylase
MLYQLDPATRALVRLAAAIAGSDEEIVRREIETCADAADPNSVEEIILQSYLFAGFPRALNAARLWRTATDETAPADADAGLSLEEWRTRGERTCAVVYGDAYERLRSNIRALHPALDEWMIVEGYGKVLSRPGLSLKLRELAIVAACAASRQQRQLHSHLHGALNAGARPEEVEATLRALTEIVPATAITRYRALLNKVIRARKPAPTS